MFASLTTKLAMKKLGIPNDPFNLSSPDTSSSKKLTKKQPQSAAAGSVPGLDEVDGGAGANKAWPPAWMTVKNLPLTAQAWLTPPPPPIPVGECPRVGDLAPLDRDRKLVFGGGRKVLVVFLRCVGCAFAQKQFLALRTLANRHANELTCIAVSHSSEAATTKWLDLLGGAWNVQVVVDEDRAVYAAWGLGLGSVWYVLNPATQVQSWKEKGWLGASVATSIQKSAAREASLGLQQPQKQPAAAAAAEGDEVEGPGTVMGNKWQQSGAWAVDGRGSIVWGDKAAKADDVLDLQAGVTALGIR